jgi:hypothetical protein
LLPFIDHTPVRLTHRSERRAYARGGVAQKQKRSPAAGGGVLFIPAHLVAEVVGGAAKTQVKDLFGFEMISGNKFTTAQIDKNTWTKEMLDLLMEFIATDERAADYRGLDWSQEYEYALNGDPSDTQSAL